MIKLCSLVVVIMLTCALSFTACTTHHETEVTATDSVAANIKMYSHTWDEIINNGKFELFNDSNFTKDVVMHIHPDITGIDSARAYYENYKNGFSNVKFTIVDVFGQGNKLVKHWRFQGKHTGNFFGIPPTNKDVDIEGVTLVRMQGGKIAEEEDFLDNLSFMQQLGLIPGQ